MESASRSVSMFLLATLCLGLLVGTPVLMAAPPTTIVIDGVNDFEVDESYNGTSGSTWYFTYDDTNFYFGISATDVGSGSSTEFVVLYLGTGGPGTTSGVLYDTQQPTLPFPANFHFRWKTDNTYINMLDYNSGTASWTDDNLDPGNFGISGFQNGNYVEFSIPRASLGNPSTLNVAGSMINELAGSEWTFFMVPDTNIDGYDANFTDYHTFVLQSPPVPSIQGWAALLLAATMAVLGWRILRRRAAVEPA
jgi:hypothetical protein